MCLKNNSKWLYLLLTYKRSCSTTWWYCLTSRDSLNLERLPNEQASLSIGCRKLWRRSEQMHDEDELAVSATRCQIRSDDSVISAAISRPAALTLSCCGGRSPVSYWAPKWPAAFSLFDCLEPRDYERNPSTLHSYRSEKPCQDEIRTL